MHHIWIIFFWNNNSDCMPIRFSQWAHHTFIRKTGKPSNCQHITCGKYSLTRLTQGWQQHPIYTTIFSHEILTQRPSNCWCWSRALQCSRNHAASLKNQCPKLELLDDRWTQEECANFSISVNQQNIRSEPNQFDSIDIQIYIYIYT